MKLYWIYIVCVILCVQVDRSSEQSIPANPCPNMFQYQREGYEWVGFAQVQSLPLGQITKLEVMLSLRAKLPSQYVGELQLRGTREDAIQEIRSNQYVRYRVRFPLQNPLPKLTQLSVNGQVLCSGSPETGPFVTQIRLEHTLFTEIAAGQSVSGFDNNINLQDPFVIYDNQDNYYSETYKRPTAPSQPSYQAHHHYQTTPQYQTYPQFTTSPPQQTYPVQPEQTIQPSQQQPQPQPPPQQSTVTTSQSELEICGRPHVKNNFVSLVVGGETVSRGAWPWLVAVYLNKAVGPTFNCGGNLISAKTVVTAAHCFRTSERTYQAHEVVLFLGRYNILNWMEAGVIAAQVEQIVIHSDYMLKDTSYDADIAVAIMKQRVEFTEFIRPICLWEGSENLNSVEGQWGTVIGWGRDGTGNIVTPEPKKISIPIVSEAECLRSSDTYRYITSQRTFCAGGRDGKGPCNGDSGGGMTFKVNNKWMLRGIVSAALADPIINTCNLGDYVVFTDAAKFVNWIKLYMR